MIKAIKLVIKEGTLFDLYFDDGSVKRYDILTLADKFPQLNELKNRNLFVKGKLFGFSGVYWNDELDVSAETVYEEGIEVSDEYDDIASVVFGYKLKEERLKKQLTQEDLSSMAHIDQADLSKIENGTSNPSLKTINKILKELGCRFDIHSLKTS